MSKCHPFPRKMEQVFVLHALWPDVRPIPLGHDDDDDETFRTSPAAQGDSQTMHTQPV